MNRAASLFALYVLVVAAAFFARPFTLKTDFLDIAPSVRSDRKVEEVLDRLSKGYTNRVNILFGSKGLKEAKDAGIFFKNRLADQPLKVVFLIGEDGAEIQELLAAHNHRLLSDNTAELLEKGEFAEARDRALTMLYSPVSVMLLPLEQDPFFLATDFMMNLGLTKSNFFPSQDVLSANRGGMAYAYMVLELEGFSPAYLLPIIEKINEAQTASQEAFPNVSINISGVPLHSAHAISNSMVETNIIAGASVLLIILISWVVFRSLHCFFYALFTIGASVALAFMLTALIFGQIHVLTVVFGASLISLCLDYHIHYFAEWGVAKCGAADDPWPNIGKAVAICLATSLLGFVAMMFSGVPILFHMAVFAALGLSNTYIIIRFLYPALLKKTKAHAIPAPLIKLEKRLSKAIIACFKKQFYLKTTLIVLVSGIGICMINPGDGLKNLYTPEKSLLEKEALFAEISGTASAPVMIVVQGKNEQEVLEKEEEIRLSLDGFDYRAASQAIPSLRKQKRNYALTKALYKNELSAYLATIGTPKGIKEKMEAHLASQKDSPLMSAEMPKALKPLLTEDSSVLIIENAADKAKLARIADEHGALFSDRFHEISQNLKALRARASIFLALTCTMVFCVLAYLYKGAKKAALMVLPSFLSVIIALGIFGFAGVQISLFHILALFLVVYLGADYAIFRVEEKDKEGHTGVAVALSCLTSIATFGALGLTSFAVTKALGLTLCLGLTFSYLLSPLAALRSQKEGG